MKSLYLIQVGVNPVSYQTDSLLPSHHGYSVLPISLNDRQAQKESKPHVAVVALSLGDFICSSGSQ